MFVTEIYVSIDNLEFTKIDLFKDESIIMKYSKKEKPHSIQEVLDQIKLPRVGRMHVCIVIYWVVMLER